MSDYDNDEQLLFAPTTNGTKNQEVESSVSPQPQLKVDTNKKQSLSDDDDDDDDVPLAARLKDIKKQQQQKQQVAADDDDDSNKKGKKEKKNTNNKNDNAAIQLPFLSDDRQIEIIPYGDKNKSVVVRGVATNPAATRHHTAVFKADNIGARYNGKLSDPVTKASFCGWVCTLAKLPALAAAVKELKSPAADDKKKKGAAAAGGDGAAPAADNGQPAGAGAPFQQKVIASNDLMDLIRYSEKSVALKTSKGCDTTKIKELGGKFLPKLKNATTGAVYAGWIFPLTKSDKVKELVTRATVRRGRDGDGDE